MPNDINQVLKERGKTHGSFPTQANLSQQFKLLISKELSQQFKTLTPAMDESLDMIVHKLSRIICGNAYEKDHWIDIAGYATLVANELSEIKDL